MPLVEDQVRALQQRTELPEGSVPGTRLTWLGPTAGDIDWVSDPDSDIRVGNGDPNGAVNAPKGTLYVERDAPALWINDDGLSSWTPVGSSGGESYVAASVSGSTTVDFTTAHVHKLTMTGNITLTLSGATSGEACGLTLYLVQDGTGSRLVTWPGSVKWPVALAPTLSTGVNAIDIVVLETFDGGTSWFANLAGKAYA